MISKNFRYSNEVILSEVSKGHEFQRSKNFEKAEAIYLTVLSQNSSELNALFALAALYQEQGKLPLAINLFKRLMTLCPPNAAIYNNLGGCLHQEQDFQGSKEAYRLANTLSKGKDPDILSNLGGLYVNDAQPSLGLPFIDQALAIKPDHPHANWNKSLLCLELEDWRTGFALYESGIKTGDRKHKTYGNIPLWDGSNCDTIIVCGEQGIGDEIMFSSILIDLAACVKTIIFDCHPRLVEVFQHRHKVASLCNLVVMPTRKQVEVQWLEEYSPDFYVNVGSLGSFFRHENSDFTSTCSGYLSLPHDYSNRWKRVLDSIDKRPKIGLSWFGGAKKTRSDVRSIPLELLIPVINDEKYTWINLQYNVTKDSLSKFESHAGVRIHHVTSEDDYFSWVGLINACDLVISVCTSIVHICGAYNKPCLCMAPKQIAWRYGLSKDKMIWYDSVELIRQQTADNWSPVIQFVKERLPSKLKEIGSVKVD